MRIVDYSTAKSTKLGEHVSLRLPALAQPAEVAEKWSTSRLMIETEEEVAILIHVLVAHSSDSRMAVKSVMQYAQTDDKRISRFWLKLEQVCDFKASA